MTPPDARAPASTLDNGAPPRVAAPRMTWRSAALTFAAYAALAVAATYPLVLHLGSVVPHDVGDPLLSVAILWWNAHVVPLTARWWDGFAFYPAAGFMAFSDHRLGESLIATPLQWLGCSPVVAYNVVLLATYALSAMAAHWLGFVLTRRHEAAALCGLAYGFAPFRAAHIQHLELLAAFGLPAALAALHEYLESREQRWLFAASAALVVQGLCASYYLLFSSVLLFAWMIWFLRGRSLRVWLAIGAALAAAPVILLPVAAGYWRIHAFHGFHRRMEEILIFSADVTGLATASPTLALWGWMTGTIHPEGEIFPGLTVVLVAAAGAAAAWRRCPAPRDRGRLLSMTLLGLAIVPAAVAAAGWWLAPWQVTLAGVRVSSAAPYKPLSLAVVLAAASALVSPRWRQAAARHSAIAFYAVAALLMYVCSFGPRPAFAGHQVLYRPPYAWLMHLPLFDSVRVPARFAMLAQLALAAAAALAFARVRLRRPAAALLAGALMAGVIADGWMAHLPLPPLPQPWPLHRAAGFSAVLELPLGDVFGDLAAMYRATLHGLPVVNGGSGFEPRHYFPLKTALAERDPAVFEGLPPRPILIAADTAVAPASAWQPFLETAPHAAALGQDGRWLFFSMQPQAPLPVCRGADVPLVSAATEDGPVDLAPIVDGNPRTFWTTLQPQHEGDALVLGLGREVEPCAVVIAIGEFGASYPRRLAVDVSPDAAAWQTVASRRTAGLAVRGGLEDPRTVPIVVALPRSAQGRFVRLRLEETFDVTWIITDVRVLSRSGVR